MRGYTTLIALLCGSVAVPAMAQSNVTTNSGAAKRPTHAGAGKIEEIVVSALKSRTSVQKAPTTVTIVRGTELARKSVASVQDLQTVVPGIRLQQSPGGLINPVVRGLGTSSTVSSFEQSIGLFIDGVFAGHPREYASALFDVDHIELLEGTQASVVGKDTSLGAISIVNNKPQLDSFGYILNTSHEFALGGNNVNGEINVPVTNNFAIRVAGLYDQESGWIKNAFGLPNSPDIKRDGVRVSARWQPTDAIDWTVYVQHTNYNQEGQYFHVGIDNGYFASIATALGDPDFQVVPFQNRYTPRPGFSAFGFSAPGSRNNNTKLNSAFHYDLGSATITSTTGYVHYTDAYLFDGYGLYDSPLNGSGYESDDAFSQELRIGSNGDPRFSYVLGAYYYYDKWSVINGGNYLPILGIGGVFDNFYTQRTNTASVFGQVGYKITDAFHLVGSLRYENVHKSGDYSRDIITPGLLTEIIYPPFAPVELARTENFVTGSAEAQYFVNPGTMIYASYATGTKAFGFQNLPFTPLVNGPYSTEHSETFEIGTKIALGGGSHLNIAGYHTIIGDYQIGVNEGAFFSVFNDNLRDDGFDVQFLQTITPGLVFNTTVTYADVEKRGALRTNSIGGEPFSPRWSGIAKLDYRTPLTERYELFSEANVEFRTAQYLSDEVTFDGLIGKQPGYAKLGLELGVEDARRGISLSVVATNLLNENNLTSAFPGLAPGTAAISEDRPRTVMLQLSIKG